MASDTPTPPSSVTLPTELVAEICETLDALRRSPDSHFAAKAQRLGTDLRARFHVATARPRVAQHDLAAPIDLILPNGGSLRARWAPGSGVTISAEVSRSGDLALALIVRPRSNNVISLEVE